MARPFRVEYANAVYHVTARGNERKAIYHDDADRQRFLETIEEVLGQACKPDVAEAWQAFIDNILHLMQSGAKARKKNGAS